MKAFVVLVALVVPGSLAMAADLPIPPMPPDLPPHADAAPVPNVDLAAPVAPKSESLTVNVKLYRATFYDPSAGFAPGSRYQNSEDRKPIQTPGFSISVPLK